jgi:outer membrane protein insertion porin family
MVPTNTMLPSNTMLPNPYPNSGPIPNGAGAGGYAAGGYGYSTPGAYASPSDYGAAVAPGVTQLPNTLPTTLAPGAYAGVDPSGIPFPDITSPGGTGYQPRQRISPIDVFVQEARTGRIILGGSVNSDLGVAGQLVIDERNFDIRSVPHSWSEMWSGRAFRGGGQNFRAELMPGNQVQRYTVNWTERNLFGYLPYSLSVGGFYFTRIFRDWTEQRLGGRAALGYEVTKDLSISGELRLEDVNMSNPRVAGVEELDSSLGSNDVYTARFRVARDTRDSPFMSTEGALLELIFDQVFGEYDFSRGNVNYSRYFLMRERADGGGRHTLASTWRFGVTGSQTPIFENFYAGGYSTLRGFSFRGASPTVDNVQVGGELMFLGSLEYLFPLTADEMLRGVAFVDYGTVEQDLTISSENFRVAPGLGLRVSVPALGPAPLAFDFAYPLNHADTDDRQVFSFFMGFTR